MPLFYYVSINSKLLVFPDDDIRGVFKSTHRKNLPSVGVQKIKTQCTKFYINIQAFMMIFRFEFSSDVVLNSCLNFRKLDPNNLYI